MNILASGKKLNVPVADYSTSVSILMSVYNEEKVIARKLESIFSSNYNFNLVEVIIGSDCSDDSTDEIIRSYSKKFQQIKFYRFEARIGKPAVLNQLAAKSKNEILILTDANVFFNADAIKNLVRHFADEKTGMAGATILNEGMRKDGISTQENKYIQTENRIKFNEGVVFKSMIGPFGGCFAMRKNIFEPIPESFNVDDFYLGMLTLEKKYYAICDNEAICYEDVSNEVHQEFRRKVRISGGNFQNLHRFRKFLYRPFTAVGFCFLSHKVFRWWGPFALMAAYISSLMLSVVPFYSYACWVLFILFLMPVVDALQQKLKLHNYLIRLISYFVMMNLALLAGYINFKKGISTGVWGRTERR